MKQFNYYYFKIFYILYNIFCVMFYTINFLDKSILHYDHFLKLLFQKIIERFLSCNFVKNEFTQNYKYFLVNKIHFRTISSQ